MNDIETKMIHWEQVVSQQQQSGQTIKDFCQQNNIQYQRFLFWKFSKVIFHQQPEVNFLKALLG